MDYSTKSGDGSVEFFHTPMGTVLLINVCKGDRLCDVKMYDKSRSSFALQNVFCGENLVLIEEGKYVSVSTKLHIEEAIGRDFLIKTENFCIVARPHSIKKERCTVDKGAKLVYN
jgi:hypothetical protein